MIGQALLEKATFRGGSGKDGRLEDWLLAALALFSLVSGDLNHFHEQVQLVAIYIIPIDSLLFMRGQFFAQIPLLRVMFRLLGITDTDDLLTG